MTKGRITVDAIIATACIVVVAALHEFLGIRDQAIIEHMSFIMLGVVFLTLVHFLGFPDAWRKK